MHDYWTLMKKLIWLRILQGASFVVNKITGTSPITLTNAINSAIISLKQYGKCVQDGTSPVNIMCNNGTLKWDSVNQRIYADGTPEVVTLSASGEADQTATVENLYAVDNIADEQDIITGKVICRTEAVVSDGITPSGRYIGTVGVGNIIVRARETGYSGEVASFTTEEGTPLNGLCVNLEPIQDLHGYDNPWPSGGGKNKIDEDYSTNYTNVLLLSAGTYYFQGFAYDTSSVNSRLQYKVNDSDGWATLTEEHSDENFSFTGWLGGFMASGEAKTGVVAVTNPIYIRVWKVGGVLTGRHISFSSEQLASWTPYSNICPIYGHTDADVIVSPTLNPLDGKTYPIPLGQTVYGGTPDVLTGMLTVDKAYALLNDPDKWSVFTGGNVDYIYSTSFSRKIYQDSYTGLMCTAVRTKAIGYLYGRWRGADSPLFGICDINGVLTLAKIQEMAENNQIAICYDIEPQTIQLTPTQVELLQGENNIWSDANSINVYVSDGELIIQVAPQKLKTAKGTNVVEVTSNIDLVTLEVEYKENR